MQKISSAVDAFREVIKNPSLDRARISHRGDSLLLRTVWSQRDIERREKTSLLKTYLLSDDTEKLSAVSINAFPQELPANELWRVESPSGEHLAVIRSCKPQSILDKAPSTEERFFMELYEEDRRVRTVDLLAFEAHGRVYEADNTFGCCEWSHSEGHVLYIAELKRDKCTSYFDPKLANESRVESQMSQADVIPKNVDARVLAPRQGGQYDYVDNWGEQLVEKSRSGLFLYNLDTNAVSRVENVPSGVSPATALWAPEDEGLVYVGYQEGPFRLGLIYCVQRPSAIYFLEFAAKETDPQRLSRLDASVRSPRFSPDQSKLVWLETELGGTHGQCARVILCDWNSKRVTTVIDTVMCCSARSEFAGVYCDLLPSRCWLSDSRRIILHTLFGSTRHAICIDVLDRVGRRLTRSGEANERPGATEDQPVAMFGSYSVLDVDPVGDIIVGMASAPNKPDHLVVGRLRLSASNAIDQFRFEPLAPAQLRLYDEITWAIETHFAGSADTGCVHRSDQCASRFESFLLLPTGLKRDAFDAAENTNSNVRHPLIVLVHGGPHGTAATEFSFFNAAWCLLGYAVLVVNFRGSLGFGSASIDSLVGNVGVNDVADCVQAIDFTLDKYSTQLDANRVYVTGGSHGGFLTAHLLARLGTRIRAGAARNPVINLYSMLGTTDIPDWVFVEAVSNSASQPHRHDADLQAEVTPNAPKRTAYSLYTPGRLPNEQELLELRRRSPLTSVVQNIDSFPPLAIMIGDQDVRVHPKQGLELYRVLRAYQRTTKLIVYPQNCHPLSKIEAESDSFISITDWFRQFSD